MTEKEKLLFEYLSRVCRNGNEKVELLKSGKCAQKTFLMSLGALRMAERFTNLCEIAFAENTTANSLQEYISKLK